MPLWNPIPVLLLDKPQVVAEAKKLELGWQVL